MGSSQSVQGAKGLIHQQDLRLHRQGASDADPLLHAARQFAGTLVYGMAHVHQGQIVFNPLSLLRLGHGPGKDLIDCQFDIFIGR